MNPLQRACTLLEAATDTDLARLCGAERLMLTRQLFRWQRVLGNTDKAQQQPGDLTELADSRARP
jgi:hypothetical protein